MFAISFLLIFLLKSREPLASLLSLISCLSAKVANFDVAKSSVEYSENFGHSREWGITQYEGIVVGEGVTWQTRRTCTILFVNLETAHTQAPRKKEQLEATTPHSPRRCRSGRSRGSMDRTPRRR